MLENYNRLLTYAYNITGSYEDSQDLVQDVIEKYISLDKSEIRNETNFAIIGINELNFQQNYTRFTETSTVPRYSKIIGQTWAKVNKNGTRDKRFKSNYQIPVVRYGNIRLSTQTGLREEYEFSNYEFTEEFGKAFREFQSEFRS